MGFGSILTNLASKGFTSEGSADFQKGYHSLLSDRPNLAPSDQSNRTRTRPSLPLAYFFESEVSFFSDCVSKLGQEILRNGADWQPGFAMKCNFCGHEMQEHLPACPVCKGQDLREPDSAQLFRWRRKDGMTWADRMNDNGQTEMELLRQFEYHLDVADNSYMLCVFEYLWGDDEVIIDRIPLEFLNLDARYVEKVFDLQGRPDPNQRVCLIHRNKVHNAKAKDCSECHGKLYPIAYRTLLDGSTRYYLEHEVCFASKYNPGLLYGYPPVFKMLDDVWAYHYLEKQTRQYFERGRPNSILTIPTNNIAGTDALWRKQQEDMAKDRFYTPWMFIDPEARQPLQLLKLMDDPNSENLEVKKDLRERMGSYLGISPIFAADTSTSGGLNNEGLQITVTGRAVEWGQGILNSKPLRFIRDCLGIKDWVRVLNPNEEKDEMAELQRFQLEVQIAKEMRDIGYEVHFHDQDSKTCKHFDFSGEAKPMGGMMNMMGQTGIDQQQPPLQLGPGQQAQGNDEPFDMEAFKAEFPDLPLDADGNIDFEAHNRKLQAQTPAPAQG